MKKNLLQAALACAALVLMSTAAIAGGMPSIPVGLDHDPEGIIAHGTTNTDGSVTFRDLKPGNYVIVIDAKGLAATMDKLHPPTRASSGGISLGVGGLFGGGHRDHDGHGSHGGGVGAGIDIPLGGGDNGAHGPGGIIAILIGLLLPEQTAHGATPETALRIEVPYCRDSGGGIRVGFTIPDQARSGNLAAKPTGVRVSISDQASSGELTSY